MFHRRTRKQRTLYASDVKEAPLGLDQVNEGTSGKDDYAHTTNQWIDTLKPQGWRYCTGDMLHNRGFIPASLAKYTVVSIKKHGIEGTHYCLGWQGLKEMIETRGLNHAPHPTEEMVLKQGAAVARLPTAQASSISQPAEQTISTSTVARLVTAQGRQNTVAASTVSDKKRKRHVRRENLKEASSRIAVWDSDSDDDDLTVSYGSPVARVKTEPSNSDEKIKKTKDDATPETLGTAVGRRLPRVSLDPSDSLTDERGSSTGTRTPSAVGLGATTSAAAAGQSHTETQPAATVSITKDQLELLDSLYAKRLEMMKQKTDMRKRLREEPDDASEEDLRLIDRSCKALQRHIDALES